MSKNFNKSERMNSQKQVINNATKAAQKMAKDVTITDKFNAKDAGKLAAGVAVTGAVIGEAMANNRKLTNSYLNGNVSRSSNDATTSVDLKGSLNPDITGSDSYNMELSFNAPILGEVKLKIGSQYNYTCTESAMKTASEESRKDLDAFKKFLFELISGGAEHVAKAMVTIEETDRKLKEASRKLKEENQQPQPEAAKEADQQKQEEVTPESNASNADENKTPDNNTNDWEPAI